MASEQILASFIVITPAHNEAAFIEKTILSMIAQTLKPCLWVIVNDNSEDTTSEIIEKYANEFPFIKLVNVTRKKGRHFGNKVYAFNQGLLTLETDNYQFIGNLDADITLDKDYYENIIAEFNKDPALGIAGGMVYSFMGKDQYVSQNVALDSVAGAVQLFRKECFEQVGGYVPLPFGGIDTAAEIMARMHGWKTWTFENLHVFENRRTGSASLKPLASKVKEGKLLYCLGYDFIFFCIRCIYRLFDRPWIIGSAAMFFGYLECLIQRYPHSLPHEVIRYLRGEQRNKLLRVLKLRE